MKKLLLVLTLGISFSACKKDNSVRPAAPAAPSVLGTWTVSEASVVVTSNFVFDIGAMAFTFNSDGTVIEDFGGGNTTVYNYKLSSVAGVNYVSFSQSMGILLGDYIRTLNNEMYTITSAGSNNLVLSREGPLNDGNSASYLTVYHLGK